MLRHTVAAINNDRKELQERDVTVKFQARLTSLSEADTMRATIVFVVRMSRIAEAKLRRMTFDMLLLFLIYDVVQRYKQQ
jgi:hypothetical protein